jgi:hypothetical protein
MGSVWQFLGYHISLAQGCVDIPDLNTRLTIDKILTIAAKCYGQKDPLKYRDNWAK